MLAIIIGGGKASFGMLIKRQEGIGVVCVKLRTTFLDSGTLAAELYAKARVTPDGILVLGRAEGLIFVAERDSNNTHLRRECGCRIEFLFPVALFWKLYASDKKQIALKSDMRCAGTLHSIAALCQSDNSVEIYVGTGHA